MISLLTLFDFILLPIPQYLCVETSVMSSAQPELPIAAYDEVDSMLSRKFGKEISNYFSGTHFHSQASSFH